MTWILQSGTVRDLLRRLNSPGSETANHRPHLGMLALAGNAADPVGVAWLAGWHRRNLNSFANLVHLAASPNERVFVVYGSGHVPLLRQFAKLSGLFAVEDALDYL